MNEKDEALRKMLTNVESKLKDVMTDGPRSAALFTDFAVRWAAMSACLVAVDMTMDGEPARVRELKRLLHKSLDDNFMAMYERFMEELGTEHGLVSAFDGNAKLREELLRMVEREAQS